MSKGASEYACDDIKVLHGDPCFTATLVYMPIAICTCPSAVTLAQLVKAFVGQADVQRFEPHLG